MNSIRKQRNRKTHPNLKAVIQIEDARKSVLRNRPRRNERKIRRKRRRNTRKIRAKSWRRKRRYLPLNQAALLVRKMNGLKSLFCLSYSPWRVDQDMKVAVLLRRMNLLVLNLRASSSWRIGNSVKLCYPVKVPPWPPTWPRANVSHVVVKSVWLVMKSPRTKMWVS